MSEKINRLLLFGKTRKRTQTPSFFIKAFRNQGINVRAINYRKMERLWGKWLTERYLFSTFNRFQPQLVFINTIDIPFKMLSQISGKTKVAIYLPDLITLSDSSASSGLITRYKEEMIERGKYTEGSEREREIYHYFSRKVGGGGWERYGLKFHKRNVYPDEFAKICSGAKIILGIDVSNQVEGYFSNRTWITLGCV